jgi:hypothetical protein
MTIFDLGNFYFYCTGTYFKNTNLNMYLFHLLNFHNQEKHKKYGLSKLNIMNCNIDKKYYLDFEMVESFLIFWLGN